jgi:hypothetical protein
VRDGKGVTIYASSKEESSKEARKEKEIVLLHMHTHKFRLEKKFSSPFFRSFFNDLTEFPFPMNCY